MAATITFVSGNTTVTLPGPIPDYPVSHERRQNISRSASGTVYVYDKSVDIYEVELTFQSLSATQKASLDSFFGSTVQGGVTTFTYTDTNGTAYTARFLDGVLRYTKLASEVWDVSFKLDLSTVGT